MIFAFPLPPIAIGIAVLRYRLYDIDRIISRTIAYASVSGMLLVVYAGLILVLQGPLGTITGGKTVAVAASTLVAAALFQPMRRRTQAAVDHRFNRARYDAQTTVAGFSPGPHARRGGYRNGRDRPPCDGGQGGQPIVARPLDPRGCRPMNGPTVSRRPGVLSIAMIVASIGASIAISVAMDVVVLGVMPSAPGHILVVVRLLPMRPAFSNRWWAASSSGGVPATQSVGC